MVKRGKTEISVESVNIQAATGDKLHVKDKGAWRYPHRVIARASHLDTAKYHDERDLSEKLGRRKIESNFMITLNTNKTLVGGGLRDQQAKEACKTALEVLSSDMQLCTYLKFGPKSNHYANDKYEDVIERVEWKASVETGENLHRLHAHIWLTVHHYSQVQVNMPMMQRLFKTHYNHAVYSAGHSDLVIKRQPYIKVKLLPTSDWAMVIRQYIHKGMDQAATADFLDKE